MGLREALAYLLSYCVISIARARAASGLVVAFALAFSLSSHAQQPPTIEVGVPLEFDTYTPDPCSPNGQPHGACEGAEVHRIRLVPIAVGLENPWHIAFLPDGGLLVSESSGRLRLIRDSMLVPDPIAGWPVPGLEAQTLNSVLVHPNFGQNGFVYVAYRKGRSDGMTSVGLARGRLGGTTLTDVQEIFVADAWVLGGPVVSRAEFGPDGMVYLAVNDHDALNRISDTRIRRLAQHLGSDVGKVLRLRDDGGIPDDNPFVNDPDSNPQIYTYGHRNPTGLAWHPDTGELWSTEIGPMGGDELNILRPGHNYGWPVVSLGKLYNSSLVSAQSWWRPDMDMPFMHWTPSISPSGLTFYTGDRFPWWRGHAFLGALNGQMLQRVFIDLEIYQNERREALLTQLDRRVRHVAQGPDGYLYIATDTSEAPDPGEPANGVIFRIEPAE